MICIVCLWPLGRLCKRESSGDERGDVARGLVYEEQVRVRASSELYDEIKRRV